MKPQRNAAICLICLIISIAAICPFFLYSATDSVPLNRYQIDFFDYRRGLPEENVTAVTQTPDGYLWLGGNKGLYRFDGITFELMDNGPKDRKSPVAINALAVDKDGVLWVGGFSGITKYENREFTFCTEKQGFVEGYISYLDCDRLGNLWFSVRNKGLFQLKDGKLANYNASNGLTTNTIYSFAEDDKGYLWVSGYQDGLFVNRGGRFEKFPITAIEKKYAVYWITFDSTGTLWVGTNRGLVEIDKNHNFTAIHSTDTGIADSLILGPINEDKRGHLWVGTSQGLTRMIRQPSGGYSFTNLIPRTTCFHMYRDREDNLWIASLGQGLGRLRDSPFRTYTEEHGVNMYFNSLFVTREGELLAGSSIGQLHRYQNGRFDRFLRIDNTAVTGVVAMAEDRDGALWLGTLYSGLVRVKDGEITRFAARDGLGSQYIRALTCDHKDRLWIGTRDGGLTLYEKNENGDNGGDNGGDDGGDDGGNGEEGRFRVFGPGQGLVDNHVYNIFEDHKKNIWIGTTKGLQFFPNGNLDPPAFKTFLKGKFILGIYEDFDEDSDNNVFWICTHGHGLLRFDPNRPGKTFSYNESNGMPCNNFYTILKDNKENLWLTCSRGIARVNINQLNRLADGQITHVECHVFGREDGLNSTMFRALAKSDVAQTPDGRFWFATQRGISSVHPLQMTFNKIPPAVNIKTVLFNYEPVPLSSNGRTFKGIKDIMFHFSVPTMVSPRKIKIKYRLEGHDKEWWEIDAFEPRQAHYKKLPYGAYRFRVIAANSSGVWNKQGAVFDFTLEPFFYQTMMFKASLAFIIALAFVSSLFSLRRYLFMKKLKQKYKNSTLDPEKAEKVLKKADYLMEFEKTYTDETLSLDSLAEKLSIPPRYLSQIINERLKKNFRDYINYYRIEAAKEFLANPYKEKLSILEIALEVGFNSKEVFNRAFKKFTNMTPTEYKKQTTQKTTH